MPTGGIYQSRVLRVRDSDVIVEEYQAPPNASNAETGNNTAFPNVNVRSAALSTALRNALYPDAASEMPMSTQWLGECSHEQNQNISPAASAAHAVQVQVEDYGSGSAICYGTTDIHSTSSHGVVLFRPSSSSSTTVVANNDASSRPTSIDPATMRDGRPDDIGCECGCIGRCPCIDDEGR